MTKKDELTKYSEELVLLLKSEKEPTKSQIYIIINKMINILGADYSLIKQEYKKHLGAAWIESASEMTPYTKATATRNALGMLRGLVISAHGSRKQIESINKYIQEIDKGFEFLVTQDQDAAEIELLRRSQRACDFIYQLMISGYGEVKGEGFNYKRTIEASKSNIKNEQK